MSFVRFAMRRAFFRNIQCARFEAETGAIEGACIHVLHCEGCCVVGMVGVVRFNIVAMAVSNVGGKTR